MTIYHSHSLFVMMSMPDNSVDSIVTDPPYGLSFMGKKWDYDVPSVQLWREALRVLKPGGHLLAFAGSRTYHRMAVNIEDAGFEIRDQIMWLYGSGFPKSHDISKAIDKAAGAEREVVGKRTDGRYASKGTDITGGKFKGGDPGGCDIGIVTAPATPEAKQWDGWGTALKPAHEPIVVARKPVEGTVAENVLKYGTGGINIDGGRIGLEGEKVPRGGKLQERTGGTDYFSRVPGKSTETSEEGRWPANIMMDKEAAAILDAQSGELTSGENPTRRGSVKFDKVFSGFRGQEDCTPSRGADTGGASRFFYVAKANKQDRDEGLDGMKDKTRFVMGTMEGGTPGQPNEYNGTTSKNHHPTVKPTELMQYLVRLVTPKGGITFDPFMGSGSTGKAAVREGFIFIGAEREAEYIQISIARINAPAQVTLL